MPSEVPEGEIFNPAHGGGVRVPLERPVVAPKKDLTGRDPEGPKTAKFDPDDLPADGAIAATGGRAEPTPLARPGKKTDETLKRFLES
jgi:hypothetical protein